jgi:GGDEF domain-containing protein
MAIKSNKGEITAWRLPKISKPPGLADILALAEQAAHRKDHPVNMRWMFGNPSRSYCLTASSTGLGTSEGLLWSLASGEALHEVELWMHMSADCTLIHSMVMDALNFPEASPASSSGSNGGKISLREAAPVMPVPDSGEVKSDEACEILRGDLAKNRIDQFFELLASGNWTGRVEITNKDLRAEVGVIHGQPVHASYADLVGDAAIIELIGLREGLYEFRSGPPTEARTVTKNLEALLFARNSLINYSNYLKDHRLKEDTPLIKLSPDLSESEFERLVAAAAPVDMQKQKQIYLAVDGKSTLSEILKRYPLPRSEWIPIFFNLLACQLVTVIEIPKIPYLPLSAAVIELNQHLLRTIRDKIVTRQTGLYTYPAFLLFLEQEVNRYLDCRRPFSLILLKLTYRDLDPNDLVMQEAAVRALAEPLKKISELKRRCDIFCQYRTSEYALLLPESELKLAHHLIESIANTVKGHALSPSAHAHSLTMECGVANIPEQCDTPEALLALAEAYQKVF